MKKTLLTIAVGALALSLSAISLAQEAGPVGGAPKATKRASGPLARATKLNHEVLAQLNLTDDQKAKVKDLDTKANEDLKKAAADAKVSGDKLAAKEKAKTILKDYRKDLVAILTPDQQKQYKQLYKEAVEKAKAAKAAKAAPATPAAPTAPAGGSTKG